MDTLLHLRWAAEDALEEIDVKQLECDSDADVPF